MLPNNQWCWLPHLQLRDVKVEVALHRDYPLVDSHVLTVEPRGGRVITNAALNEVASAEIIPMTTDIFDIMSYL